MTNFKVGDYVKTDASYYPFKGKVLKIKQVDLNCGQTSYEGLTFEGISDWVKCNDVFFYKYKPTKLELALLD